MWACPQNYPWISTAGQWREALASCDREVQTSQIATPPQSLRSWACKERPSTRHSRELIFCILLHQEADPIKTFYFWLFNSFWYLYCWCQKIDGFRDKKKRINIKKAEMFGKKLRWILHWKMLLLKFPRIGRDAWLPSAHGPNQQLMQKTITKSSIQLHYQSAQSPLPKKVLAPKTGWSMSEP